MGTKEDTQKMRKRNMKLFPTYKKIAWDFLFFYTIDFMFLTQIKNISAADVVLKSSFYALFTMILQIPSNIIVSFLGRKNSLLLGNILNCLYMVIIMASKNLGDLIFAEFVEALAFSIKNIVETSLLNASIPPSKYKGKIFSKINSKGATGYYILNAISKIFAGYLFTINGYLPIICSLIILIIATIMSSFFIEPVQKKKESFDKTIGIKEIKDIRDGFKFVFKSERLKALLISSALITSLLSILQNYEVSLFQDIGLSASIIGIIAAVNSLLSAYASKKENNFNKRFKNKSLTIISLILSLSCIVSGICGIASNINILFIVIIIISDLMYGFGNGIYYTIIDRYLSNFTNKNIDTKIYSAYNLFRNIIRVMTGFFASFLLDKTTTAKALIIIGIIFTILYILTEKYMKTRIGLKPEEYSKEERKYDELTH